MEPVELFCACVGDGSSNKSTFISHYISAAANSGNRKDPAVTFDRDKQPPPRLHIFDVPSKWDGKLPRKPYIVIFFFSDASSLASVVRKWAPRMKPHMDGVPSDLARIYGPGSLTSGDGKRAQWAIGAQVYFECAEGQAGELFGPAAFLAAHIPEGPPAIPHVKVVCVGDPVTRTTAIPFRLFTPIVLSWITGISEKMIAWIGNAIKIDTFEIDNKRDRTSTSLVDTMAVFSQSIQFLKALQWEGEAIDVFVETFLSLCVSCLRLYTEELTLKMLSYFPLDLFLSIEKRHSSFSGYIPDFRKMTQVSITPAQIFVIINNFMNLRPYWMRFLDAVRDQFPQFVVSDVFAQPVPRVGLIAKTVPFLFASLTSEQPTADIGANDC
jgi:hypothetical protein